MSEKAKRIVLIGSDDPRFEETLAAGTIKPGHLIQLNSAGKVVVQSTAGARCPLNFAVEDALQGRTIADSYVSGELVSSYIAKPGDVINAYLAAGENIVAGDKLTPSGDGSVKKLTSTNYHLGEALEAIDNSLSSAVAVRVRMRIV